MINFTRLPSFSVCNTEKLKEPRDEASGITICVKKNSDSDSLESLQGGVKYGSCYTYKLPSLGERNMAHTHPFLL